MNNQKTYLIAILVLLGIGALLAFSNNKSEANNSIQKTSESQKTTEINTVSPHYEVKSPSIPESIDFAGEKVPLDRQDVLEKLDRELLVNTYWQSSTVLFIKRSKRLFDIIEPILKEEGVPLDFKYLAVAESGLIENAVSSSGARGIWQFMKTTGKKYGLESNSAVEERYNTVKATKAACKYLKNSYKETGSWALAAAAYNRGLSGILRDLKRQNVKSYYDLYLNRETGRYVYRIVALKAILSNPSKYGFSIPENEYYATPNTYTEVVDTTIDNLAKFAQAHGTNYLQLRTLNPWLISYSLPNKSRKKYTIRIPYIEVSGMEE